MKLMSVCCGRGNVTILKYEFGAFDEMYRFLTGKRPRGLEVTHAFVHRLLLRRNLKFKDGHWMRLTLNRGFPCRPFIVRAGVRETRAMLAQNTSAGSAD